MDLSQFLLLPNSTKALAVAFTPATTANKGLTWATSNSAVATVDAAGVVTAVAAGTAIISATSVDRPMLKVATTVSVLKDYTVHVVGKGDSEHYTNAALYWKNGVPSELQGGHIIGTAAFAVTASGADIYIAGSTVNSSLWSIATYWKNGMPVQLSDPLAQNNTYARSIAVSGGSVYVAGYSFTNTECPAYCFGRSRASLWVNKESVVKETPLYNTIATTQAFSIALSGADVLVAGSRSNSNFGRWSTIWKNDFSAETSLSNTTDFNEATAIAVSESDVYTAGYGSCAGIGCAMSAKLWKNGSNNAIVLTDGTTEAQASGIAVSNGIVYISGYEKNSAGKYVSKYWKVDGNNVTSYALTDGARNALANGITVVGDDVFIAGFEENENGNKVAKYWRAYKGMAVAISLQSASLYTRNDSEAFGICVQ